MTVERGMPSAEAASRSWFGHQQQHVLGGAHDDGNDDHRQRQRAGDAREIAHRHDHHAVDEQADDDRGRDSRMSLMKRITS
jgi:hypothetical protein